MEAPVCITQYFTNKLNVRSFQNITTSKLLKSSDTLFLQDIFEDKKLVSHLPQDLNLILLSMRENLKKYSKEDFRNYFSLVSKTDNKLCSVDKEEVFECCWKAINDVVPKSFYGVNHNSKIFRKIVHSTIFSMRKQHVMVSKLLKNWRLSMSPWLNLQENEAVKLLHHIVFWILKNILSPMICLNFYVTTCKLDADENKLHYFHKSQWQSFFDKKISDMIYTKTLKRYEAYCIGKKVKRKYNLTQRLEIKVHKKEIPKLHLVLKPNNQCRPIVRYKYETQNKTEKYKFKEQINFLKLLTGTPYKKVEYQFSSLYLKWLRADKPNLYFVKTDLSNAFGSVNRDKLMKIICEKHLNYQNTEKTMYLKKKYAQIYKELIIELRKPLLIRAGSTVYEWTEGLVQGYKYSPALSELYYMHMDKIYFSEHLNNSISKIKLFARVVDDYLYITDSEEDAHSFLKSLSNHKNVNYSKTVVNFPHETIKCCEQISFLGYSYNTKSMEVSRSSNVFAGQMCYKLAFSNAISNLGKFLESRIGQSGIQINGHIFNLYYEDESLIWQHIFTAFCLSANKFCTILAILCEPSEMSQYLLIYKKRVTTKLSNSIIETLDKNKPKDAMFVYCINHFRYLSMKALYLCAKLTHRCNGLIPTIRDELAKSNCLFGKWHEHFSHIESTGKLLTPAVKEVCRRSDLRVIMKKFETLPEGFQCFNHKKIT